MPFTLDTLYNLWQLRKSQWYDQQKLRKLQDKKLRALVNHAYASVRFYRQKFKTMSLRPSDICTVDDLNKLPVITRKEVQDNYPDNIISAGTDLSACVKRKSSGSTGTPVEAVFSKKDQAFRYAIFLRAMFECGFRITDKLATVSYYDEKITRWFQNMGIMRRRNIHSTNEADRFVDILRAYQPDVLYSYSSYLGILAEAVRNQGITDLKPRVFFSHAEMLDERTRSLVRKVFQREIFETYGSAEFMRLAWECPEHTGLHMDCDGYVIEFLEDGEAVSPGERGLLVVTSLDSYAMPLIRYSLGDYGVPSEEACSCGRGLPLIRCIEGRSDDFIVLNGGRLVSPRRLSSAIGDTLGLGEYRIIQEDVDTILVEFVKDKGYSDNTCLEIARKLKGFLGADVEVRTAIVDAIPVDRSGKIKKVTSKVSKKQGFGI